MFPQFLAHPQVCFLVIVIILVGSPKAEAETPPRIVKQGCNETCGKVSIPYPFGIGPNCYAGEWYEVECRPSSDSNGSPKPFLSKFKNLQLMDISYINEFWNDFSEYTIHRQALKVFVRPQNVCAADSQLQNTFSIDLRGSPFNFSTKDNVFVMEGCPGGVVLLNQNKGFMAACSTVCHKKNSLIPANSCYGVECCKTTLPSSDYNYGNSLIQFYQAEFNFESGADHQNCLLASLIKSDSVDKYVGKLSASNSSSSLVPVVLTWRWMNNLKLDINYDQVICRNITESSMLYCFCDVNRYGNPYLADGCQVPPNCTSCQGYCHYSVSEGYGCKIGYTTGFDSFRGLIVGVGTVFLALACYMLYQFIKRRREMKRRAKFFKHNGGLLLQQRLTSNEGVVKRTRIFKVNELEQATDHFNVNRILGQGGQGTVYKGMLTDGKIVAIKKSKLVDQSQLEQFINEVVILSQIYHRNVVDLLGCCLETEVPLLVYEFISNGALSDHIHHPNEDFFINWEMRLKIAADSAGAIAYLHSSSAMPIYHRDIKSSNILLDEKNVAKVADFGISRTVSDDQTHLTTIVQGTFGYLDPEYVLTRKFNEKSDVYSFGVVLLELLTGKKAIYQDGLIYKNLASEFQHLMNISRLSEILDPEITMETNEAELISVAKLARRCLSWNGEMRPTMKEVAMALEMLISSPDNDQASTLNQEVDPFVTDMSNSDITSNSLPAGGSSPVHTDAQPLLVLPNTL